MEKKIYTWIMVEATDTELNELVTEVNNYDGALEEYRFYPMDELNDLFCGVKPTELLSKLEDNFDVREEGFTDTIYGLESCSLEDAMDEVRNNAQEVVDAVINAIETDNIYLPESLKEYLEEEQSSRAGL